VKNKFEIYVFDLFKKKLLSFLFRNLCVCF